MGVNQIGSGGMALKLFSVTLDWGAPGSDEGDYANWVWAENADNAIEQIANEMANSGEKFFDTIEDKEEYVSSLVRRASPHAAVDVNAHIVPEIEILLKGPSGNWSSKAREDFETIKSILAQY